MRIMTDKITIFAVHFRMPSGSAFSYAFGCMGLQAPRRSHFNVAVGRGLT